MQQWVTLPDRPSKHSSRASSSRPTMPQACMAVCGRRRPRGKHLAIQTLHSLFPRATLTLLVRNSNRVLIPYAGVYLTSS